VTIPISFRGGHGDDATALLDRPDDARALLLFGHGAGAGMHHPFMEAIAARLSDAGVATFRYQFPYMAAGKRRPDPRPVLIETVRTAVAAAREHAPDLPLFAGGKSMGGRMTSLAQATQPLDGVSGLVFFGFPLHPAQEPGTERGNHLADVTVPMLFLQGDRDKLAGLDLLEPVLIGLGPRATLHVVKGGDHSFAVLKRSGRTGDEALDELAGAAARWITSVGARGSA